MDTNFYMSTTTDLQLTLTLAIVCSSFIIFVLVFIMQWIAGIIFMSLHLDFTEMLHGYSLGTLSNLLGSETIQRFCYKGKYIPIYYDSVILILRYLRFRPFVFSMKKDFTSARRPVWMSLPLSRWPRNSAQATLWSHVFAIPANAISHASIANRG